MLTVPGRAAQPSTGRGARVSFADGSSAEAEVLVGADGLRSAVRAALLGDGEPVYRGYTIRRGVGRLGAPHIAHGMAT